jgi:hypothetical protein
LGRSECQVEHWLQDNARVERLPVTYIWPELNSEHVRNSVAL